MEREVSLPCPLCGKVATAFLRDYSRMHHYFCRCCRHIEVNCIFVDGREFPPVRGFPAQLRAKLAAEAKAQPAGKLLRITLANGELQKAGQIWQGVVVDRSVPQELLSE